MYHCHLLTALHEQHYLSSLIKNKEMAPNEVNCCHWMYGNANFLTETHINEMDVSLANY